MICAISALCSVSSVTTRRSAGGSGLDQAIAVKCGNPFQLGTNKRLYCELETGFLCLATLTWEWSKCAAGTPNLGHLPQESYTGVTEELKQFVWPFLSLTIFIQLQFSEKKSGKLTFFISKNSKRVLYLYSVWFGWKSRQVETFSRSTSIRFCAERMTSIAYVFFSSNCAQL